MMSGGSHIVSLGKGDIPSEVHLEAAPDAALELTVEATQEAQFFVDEDRASAGRFGWIAPTLASLAITGWTGFFIWAHLAEMLAGPSPAIWSSWIAQWAMPTVLVVGLWLLAMRSSRREALRFGAVARSLADESAMLEARLTTVNRELSLAREFLAAQSRDLESLGRVAGDRLSENAERMAALVHKNAAQIESIASVSTTALANMDKLRDELPVIATSARDVTSQIGNAGRTAKSQLDDMISGLQRMNSFGEAGMNLTEDMKAKVSATLSELENHT
ncbi:MAG TPA: ATPase, partial [Sphingomonadaceae bacterium]|nr:ATPase [Sphingomonadaceae bacterium]